MPLYQNYEQILDALRQAPKGAAREDIINNPHNRALVANSGANVTLYSGDAISGKRIVDRLGGIYVGLLERLNANSGEPEGLGALGGLSERTSPQEFATLDISAQKALIGLKDDLILQGDEPVLITDLKQISKNTAKRETFEELGNLGIYDFQLNIDQLELVEMPGIKDDNYLVNIWNGGGNVWVITPFSHKLRVNEDLLDRLHQQSLDHNHEQNPEALGYLKMPLVDALPRFGKQGGQHQSPDGRDMQYDYRYPHEWLVGWRIASDLLDHNDLDMVRLTAELQKATPHRISFERAANAMGKDLDSLSYILNLKLDTVFQMEQVASNIYNSPVLSARRKLSGRDY